MNTSLPTIVFGASVKRIRTEVSSTGARSGHPERWMERAFVKRFAKKARRANDKKAIKED